MNFIIVSEFVQEGDREALFPDEEQVTIIQPDNPNIRDMFDILVLIGAFPSKSQARKNWKLTGAEFPRGWSEFKVGKHRKHICIWNPWA